MTAIDLNRANLSRLDPRVHVPRYDVAAVTPGIVHLGFGGFHRAHMARYTHALMDHDEAALAWGIVGGGLMPADAKMAESLGPQDALYTLVERDGTNEAASVIGSVVRVIYAGESSAALLDAIDDPRIRIVSLTVTENGYCLNRSTKKLDLAHPLIQHDIAGEGPPRSALGIVVEAYRRRMQAGSAAFTTLTCDNIQHNGDIVREAVLTLARARDASLGQWIEANAVFPNTMVDRITPVTRPDHVAHLEQEYGLRDHWPVFCEDFTQWVIEDTFVTGRPAWERTGAQFVPDVAPYEMMKLRLLNGSHLAVAAIGRLLGLTYIHEAMQDDDLNRYMAALMDRETGPTVPEVPGIDLDDYKRTLVRRFANPAVQDTIERVNTDAPLNVLIDPIRAELARGGPVDLLALALAAWMRRARGVDEAGQPIDVKHPLAAQLRAAATPGDPKPMLAMTELFGDLGHDERLVVPLTTWLGRLDTIGSRATLSLAAKELAF